MLKYPSAVFVKEKDNIIKEGQKSYFSAYLPLTIPCCIAFQIYQGLEMEFVCCKQPQSTEKCTDLHFSVNLCYLILMLLDTCARQMKIRTSILKIPPHIPFQTKCSLGTLAHVLFRCLVKRYSTSLSAFSYLFHLFYPKNLTMQPEGKYLFLFRKPLSSYFQTLSYQTIFSPTISLSTQFTAMQLHDH